MAWARCGTLACMPACLYAGDTINFAAASPGLVNVAAAASALHVHVAVASATISASRALTIRFAWPVGGAADIPPGTGPDSSPLPDFLVSRGGAMLTNPFGTAAGDVLHGGLTAMTAPTDVFVINLGSDAAIAAGTTFTRYPQSCGFAGTMELSMAWGSSTMHARVLLRMCLCLCPRL